MPKKRKVGIINKPRANFYAISVTIGFGDRSQKRIKSRVCTKYFKLDDDFDKRYVNTFIDEYLAAVEMEMQYP